MLLNASTTAPFKAYAPAATDIPVASAFPPKALETVTSPDAFTLPPSEDVASRLSPSGLIPMYVCTVGLSTAIVTVAPAPTPPALTESIMALAPVNTVESTSTDDAFSTVTFFPMNVSIFVLFTAIAVPTFTATPPAPIATATAMAVVSEYDVTPTAPVMSI